MPDFTGIEFSEFLNHISESLGVEGGWRIGCMCTNPPKALTLLPAGTG